MSKELFRLGEVVATPGALEAMREAKVSIITYIQRHHKGDWGDMADEDKQENDFSVDKELRIFSAYILPTGVKIWVITEADRGVTTFLLPDEY